MCNKLRVDTQGSKHLTTVIEDKHTEIKENFRYINKIKCMHKQYVLHESISNG